MKVLHYTLGFQPERSGGLVKYATDLMEEQRRQGYEIIALFPGKINILTKKTSIKKINSEMLNKYQIVNSLPLAIFGGIKTPEDFMKKISSEVYLDFLKDTKPDIIHVHTLMGIHKEFFQAANELTIPLVYTSHDYFGLAPEPNFFTEGNSYDDDNTVDNWIIASQDAMSTKKMRLFQVKFYPLIRKIGNKLKKKNLNFKRYKNAEYSNLDKVNDVDKKRYLKLKIYYREIFSEINGIHFNSNLSKKVFSNNIKLNQHTKVIPISNSNIGELKVENKVKRYKLNLAYIGPDKDYKGFFDFVELSKKSLLKNYEFHTYGYTPSKVINNIKQHGRYNNIDLPDIYKNIDILIIPSKWKETFGLVVLEALENKTPVLVSANVGAKDLIPNEYVFSDNIDLIEIIIGGLVNRDAFNFKVINMKNHASEILTFYNEVGEN